MGRWDDETMGRFPPSWIRDDSLWPCVSNTCLAVLIELTAQPEYSWPPRLGTVAPLSCLSMSLTFVSHAMLMTYRGGNSHPRPSVLCVAWVFTSKPELSSTSPELSSSKPESSFTFFKDTSDDSIFPILINLFILPFLKIPIFWLCAFSLPFPLHFSLHLLKPQAREKSPSLSVKWRHFRHEKFGGFKNFLYLCKVNGSVHWGGARQMWSDRKMGAISMLERRNKTSWEVYSG